MNHDLVFNFFLHKRMTEQENHCYMHRYYQYPIVVTEITLIRYQSNLICGIRLDKRDLINR